MADSNTQIEPTQTTEPTEPQGATTDWKAEARKWEKRAKENSAAAEELDALKTAQMSEQDRLVKRAEEAERKLAEANATIQHASDVADVSAQTGVPASLLQYCADRDAMEAFAKQFGESMQAQQPTHSAPMAPTNRQTGGAPAAHRSNADAFADMLDNIL